MNIYGYGSYREILHAWIAEDPGRGGRGRLAQAAKCSPSWITRNLAGKVQLTPDQALGIVKYFHLSESEEEYFISLVDFERAATPLLRQRIQKKLHALKSKSRDIASSARTDTQLTTSHNAIYYSSWIYPAVHVACMLESFSLDDLTERLGISKKEFLLALRKLERIGLVESKGTRWHATSKNIHLSVNEASTNIAHRNWRGRTNQRLQESGVEGFHYSGIHTLSKEDVDYVQDRLRQAVLDCRKTIEKSPSEVLSVFCVDWYSL